MQNGCKTVYDDDDDDDVSYNIIFVCKHFYIKTLKDDDVFSTCKECFEQKSVDIIIDTINFFFNNNISVVTSACDHDAFISSDLLIIMGSSHSCHHLRSEQSSRFFLTVAAPLIFLQALKGFSSIHCTCLLSLEVYLPCLVSLLLIQGIW